jgi:hypothetical protein
MGLAASRRRVSPYASRIEAVRLAIRTLYPVVNDLKRRQCGGWIEAVSAPCLAGNFRC